jgi:nicotinamidase-related amidase
MNEVTTAPRDALLIMDVQQGIVQRFGDDQVLLGHIAAAIAAARASGIPVIYIVVQFRKGYPEVSERNRSFSAIRSAGTAMEESNPATAIHPAARPTMTTLWSPSGASAPSAAAISTSSCARCRRMDWCWPVSPPVV